MENKTFDVVALGELLIDFTENGFSGQGNPLLEANPGGAPLQRACHAHKARQKTSFIGKVGKDMFGDQLRAAVQEVGIDTQSLMTDTEVHTTPGFCAHLPGRRPGFLFTAIPAQI